MKTTGLVKRLLISSAVLSGLFLVGTSQASADTTNEGATTATSTATTTASNQLTGSTTLKTATPASSTDTVADEATSSESTATPTTDTDTTTTPDDTTVPVTDATPDPAVTAASPSSIDATATPAPTTTTTDTTTEPQSSTKTEASSSAVTTKQTPATTTPTVSYKTARDAAVSASVVKADLQLAPEADTIQSGEAATFDLKLAISGIDKTTNPQHVVVDLPDNFQLSDGTDLTIDGVTPTLNETGTQLIYDFATPTNGLSISKKYIFDTSNQSIANDTTIKMTASYFDDTTQLATSGPQIVTITSKATYGVTNQMAGILPSDADGNVLLDADGNVVIEKDKLTGIAGDYVVYQVGISAPKKLLGQAYFDPNSPITLNYLLPKGLTFWNVDNETATKASYTTATNTAGQTLITFTIDAPTMEAQLAATDNLFSGYFDLVARIDPDTPDLTELTTQSLITATSVNQDQVTSKVAQSTITTSLSLASVKSLVDGSVAYQYNWGPADGEGNLEPGANQADPQVTPNATLAFLMQTGADAFWYPDEYISTLEDLKAITKYVATYNVDPHLNVNQMIISSPSASIKGHDVPLSKTPILDVYVRYQDEQKFELIPELSQISTTNILDMNQLIDNARGVAQLQFVYTQIPNGLNTNVHFWMTPKAGYYGQVSNDFTVDIAGWQDLGWSEVHYSKDGAYLTESSMGRVGYEEHLTDNVGNPVEKGDPYYDVTASYNQFMQPQTAEIVKPSENTPRVLNETLTFDNQTAGQVIPGENTLQVMVENNQASLQEFSGLKSVVLLPAGVNYVGNDDAITATTQSDGTTQLNINWNRTNLAPNEQNKLNIAVNIDAGLNLTSITPAIYSTVNEPDTVTPGTIDPSLATDVQEVEDTSDIDQDANTTKVFKLQQTLAVASITNSHQIHVTATATNVAGDTGNLVNAQAGNNASFGISLTPASDGALQNVTITGTMPQTGDTAVLDTTMPRGTTGQVTLNGPIELPSTWEHLATVTYALADDPTTYVAADADTDFSQVVGFQITYAGDSFLNSDAAQQLRIPVTVAKDVQTGQVAYISYAVTANGLATTEGLKAGLALQPSGELGPGIQVKTITKTPEPVFVTPDDYYDYTKPGIPGDGIWIKTQVPEGVFVTPDDYYDNTKTPDNPTGPTTDPTGPTTPVTTPSTPVPDDDSTTPSTPANTVGTPTTPTDNDATDNDTTESDSNPAQATDNDNASATTMSQISNATATMAANDASQATPIDATDTTTAKTVNNASATLPQTDEQAPATTSLIGLLLATILGGLGLSRKRRND
jgi:LPXTG-motif cell wall-anchored protein